MASLKQLRSRVSGIRSTQKITKAMQLVSAAKFKKGKLLMSQRSDYLNSILDIINIIAADHELLSSVTEQERRFFTQNNHDMHLFVVIASQRGLCGGFNNAILKQIRCEVRNLESQNKKIQFIIIGRKGYDLLKTKYPNYIERYFDITQNNHELIANILEAIITDLVLSSKIGRAVIYFNKFQHALLSEMTVRQIFPIVPNTEIQKTQVGNYEYEGKDCILNVIKMYITEQVSYAIYNSAVSEDGARMVTMDNATKNADTIVTDLMLKLNRSRQAIITKELIEIISGAEAI